MRIIRFRSGGHVHFGRDIDGRSAYRIRGELFGSFEVTKETLPIEQLLAPFIPIDILCIGLNYREHANEGGFDAPPVPMLFIKASNTLNHPGAPIPVPAITDQVDYEGELAVVIGKDAKQVSRERAIDCVFGYTIANDVTARDWQRDKNLGGGQFARGKSFDGFCPIGPAIVTKDEISEPNRLKIRSELNWPGHARRHDGRHDL